MILNFLAVGLICCHSIHAVPIATSPHGDYHGNSSIEGLDQFLGIRYAKPPVGPLRFAPPQPWPTEFGLTVDATAYGPGCPQLPAFALYNGLSEDCLTLNVIVPSNTCPETSRLPVMFFIHGGGNANGQSIFYNGTALVQQSVEIGKPIVYVSINYRLNGFGFTASPEFNDAGLSNLGLMDQHLALEWVHDNIAHFGGDPKKVTIFGESAGAVDSWAQLHYAHTHDEDEKYFRAMITQSGAPGSPAYPQALPAEEGAEGYNQLLMATNCTNSRDTIACLRAVPYDSIAPILIGNSSITQFTLDGVWFNDSLVTLLETREYSSIPIIHGANLDEGSAFMPDVFDFPNETASASVIAAYLDDDQDIASNLTSVYFSLPPSSLGKGFDADPTAPDAYYPAMAIYSDLYMHLGRRAWLKMASGSQPTWGYVFEQQPPLSTLNLSYEYPGYTDEYYRRLSVYHGSELPYVFGEISSVKNHTDGDVRLAESMMTWWITFAYELDPNCGNDVYWPPYNSTDEGVVMSLQDQGGITAKPGSDTMRQSVYDAWNDARASLGRSKLF